MADIQSPSKRLAILTECDYLDLLSLCQSGIENKYRGQKSIYIDVRNTKFIDEAYTRVITKLDEQGWYARRGRLFYRGGLKIKPKVIAKMPGK